LPAGPIALAACLQLDAVCYNAVIQEQSLGIHYNTSNDLLDYITDPSVFAYADGHVAIPTGPGLGITINEEAVARPRLSVIAGGRRYGGMRMALSRSGEMTALSTDKADAAPLFGHDDDLCLRGHHLLGPQQYFPHRAADGQGVGHRSPAYGMGPFGLQLDLCLVPDSPSGLAGGPHPAEIFYPAILICGRWRPPFWAWWGSFVGLFALRLLIGALKRHLIQSTIRW